MTDKEESISVVLDALFNTSSGSNAELTKAIKKVPWINNAENFSTIFVWDIERAVTNAISDDVQQGKSDEHGHIFFYYKIYSNAVESLTTQLEGMPCCYDRTMNIIDSYLLFLKTGEINPWRNSFSTPKVGSQKDWFDFMHGLYLFYAGGNPKDFISAYSNILNKKKGDLK